MLVIDDDNKNDSTTFMPCGLKVLFDKNHTTFPVYAALFL